jgi:carboxyl-terminal processing protease
MFTRSTTKKHLILTCFILLSGFTFAQTRAIELTIEEKIAGLSKIWSEVSYNFANFDLSKINWDETYKSYISKVLETKTTEEYYNELKKMVAQLKDSHTNVYYPVPNYAKPPLRTKLIENKLIITRVSNDALRKQNIEVGDEIIEINKTNALNYGKTNVMPYQGSSTLQDLNIRTYTYFLFYGNTDEKIELKIRKKNNLVFTTSISRQIKSDYEYKTYELRITKDKIAYLKINDFENNNYKDIFDSLYVKLRPSKALIIDVRENDGGNSEQGFYVLSHLIEKNTLSAKSRTRQSVSLRKARGLADTWLEIAPDTICPIRNKEKYLKSVIVLTGAQTLSAGEDFLVAFDNSKRGIKIGQTTGGSTGQPLFFNLPGGGSFRVCTKRDAYPDGKEFVGIGIFPEIRIQETVKSIQTKHDLVLEKAIEILKKK